MLTDWMHWLSNRHPEQLLALLWAFLLADGPRYSLSRIAMVGWDCAREVAAWLRGRKEPNHYDYCPTVCVVIAGHNEGDTIEATLHSVWGSYPSLQIIVVDDGSTDGMAEIATRFARHHDGVMVLSRPERSGKPSAANFALTFANAEVIVFVDADSHLGPAALWEIVQPLSDPSVGAVSATVLPRNAFTNLATWFQGYEYLNTIFVGRLVMARMGILGIVSGAFGAYRRAVLDRFRGPDVEPSEDFDMTLRARKAGFRIAFAMNAFCFTNVPESWKVLHRQRLRWEKASILRLLCRKHIDMAFFWSPNFHWSNFFLLLEIWVFNIVFVLGIWAYAFWCFFTMPGREIGYLFLTYYFCYVLFELPQALSILYYSRSLGRDTLLCSVFPLVPFYQAFLFLSRSWALVEETFFRKSYDLNYIPLHVRQATWRW